MKLFTKIKGIFFVSCVITTCTSFTGDNLLKKEAPVSIQHIQKNHKRPFVDFSNQKESSNIEFIKNFSVVGLGTALFFAKFVPPIATFSAFGSGFFFYLLWRIETAR